MYVCPSCRTSGAPAASPATIEAGGTYHCGTCGTELVLTPWNWRAPRKAHKTAWLRVAAGEVLWDRRAVARSAERKGKGTFEERERAAAATRARRTVLRSTRRMEREQEAAAIRASRVAEFASRRAGRRAKRASASRTVS